VFNGTVSVTKNTNKNIRFKQTYSGNIAVIGDVYHHSSVLCTFSFSLTYCNAVLHVESGHFPKAEVLRITAGF